MYVYEFKQYVYKYVNIYIYTVTYLKNVCI